MRKELDGVMKRKIKNGKRRKSIKKEMKERSTRNGKEKNKEINLKKVAAKRIKRKCVNGKNRDV